MSIANIDFTAGARTSAGAGRTVAKQPDIPLEALKAYQQLSGGVTKALGSVPRSNVDLANQIRSFADFSKPVKRKPGLLQQILGAGPVKYALAPLAAIDVPRRVLISGLKEIADAVGSGDASWSDFSKQINDPSFGVGRFVDTGNKWLDRIAGFTGDVLLDPTTYLTLGAGKFAGLAGRQALAMRLAGRGATEELVQKAGRLGINALTTAERELAGVAPAGIRFAGKRIAGTERLAETVGKGLSTTRASIGATKVGGALRRARTPEEFADLIEKLATGRGKVTAVQAAQTLDANVYLKGTQGQVLSQIVKDFEPLRQKLNASGRAQEITHLLERGVVDDELAQEVFTFLQSNRQKMIDAGIDVGNIRDYVPHVWSAQGRELLMEDSKFAVDFQKAFNVTPNEIRNPANVRTRKFVPEPGKVYDIGGKKLTFEGSTIQDINNVFRREFGFNVLEDDVVELIKGYSNNTARAFGNKAFEDRIVLLGTGKAYDDVTEEVVDKAATKAAKKEAKKEAADNLKKAQAARDLQQKVVEDLRSQYRDTVRAAVKRIRDSFKGSKKNIDVRIVALQKELNTFLTKNAADIVDLGAQAQALDNIIREARSYIDEAVAKREQALSEGVAMLSRAERIEGSAMYQELQDNIEYAQRVVDEVTAVRAELDDVVRKIDKSVIDIPTPAQLGDDVESALNRSVTLTKGTNVQPYRAGGITPGTKAYNTKNAYEEFGQAHNDAARTIGLVSPDAERLYNEAGELADNAYNARRSAGVYQDEYDDIPMVETIHARVVDVYDSLYKRFVDATGQTDDVAYGSLAALSRKKLDKLFSKQEQNIIQNFEENLVKYNRIPEVRSNYINSTQAVAGADEMLRQAAAKRAQARAQALSDFAARLEATTAGGAWAGGYAGVAAQAIPTVSADVKKSVLDSFERMLKAYDESIPVMQTIRGKEEFVSQSAAVTAKNALAAKAALHDAATALRIQYDFVGRYSNAVDVLRSKGIQFDPDAIAAKAGRNAISAEINRVNTNINQLKESLVEVIDNAATVVKEGTVATKAAEAADVVARKAAAERELVQNMESYTQFVQVYVEEYIKQKKMWNAISRGGNTENVLSADELVQLGFDVEDIGKMNNFGMGVTNIDESLADLRASIELAIFGEQSVRKEGFSFDKFLDEVTTRASGRGAGRGRPVVLDETKLRKWMMKNAVQGMTENDINRLVSAGRAAKREAAAAPTVAGAILEQIAELESRKELLQQGARTLGYVPRGSKLSADDLARVQEYVGKGLDYEDPIAIAGEVQVLNARRLELKGTAVEKKLQKKLETEQRMLQEFLAKTPKDAPPNRILRGVNNLGSMTRAGAEKRLRELNEIISGRGFGEIDKVDKAIASTLEEIKAVARITDVRLTAEGRRRVAQLSSERQTLQAQIDANRFSASRAGLKAGEMSPLEKAQARVRSIDEKIKAWNKRSTVYSGDQNVAAKLNDRLVSLRAQKAALEAELVKVERDSKFLNGILNGRFFDRKIGLPAEKATRNWQSVLFSGGLGKTRYGFKQQFIRERVSLLAREIELEDALKLPNQSIVDNTVRELDDAIAKLGDKKAIIKRIKQLEKEKAKLTPRAVKTRQKIDADIQLLRDGLKNMDENIARRQQLAERLAGGREVEAAQMKKAADDAAQPFTDKVSELRQRAETLDYQSELEATNAVSVGQQQIEQALAERNVVQEQIDNTKRIAIDANVEFQNQRTELLKIASDFENQILAARMRNAPRRAEELGQWLDNVYALYDPIGYKARVGDSALQGNDVAAQIMRLQAMPDSQEKYVVLSLMAQAQKQEADLLLESSTLSRLNQMVDAAKRPEFPKIMKKQLIEGWEALPGNRVAVPTEVSKAMERFMRIDSPSEWRKFTQMWESYTDVFKSYATLSPRFHIRNGLSASLMNFADGVSGRNAVDGVKYWRLAKADPEGWWKALPAEEQKIASDAVLAVYAAGVGQYAEMTVGKGARNRVVTASRNIGTDVEASVRMGMALDTLRGGGDVTEAASRIARIHFNYGDLSKLDKYAKRVIPFWTFMSRNIPLQMQQIWLKPRVYQMYATAVRNFRGEDNGQIVPSFYSESDMFRSPIGGGYIRPDLAWSGLESQVRQATTARGLMGQANPLVRVPIEIFAGQKAFSGAPLSEGEAPMYALESMLPFLNTARTLTGTKPTSAEGASPEAAAAGESSKLQRDINAWLSFLGVPYVQPTVSQQRGEIMRRKALLEELMKVSKQ